MGKLTFSETEKETMARERYHHPHHIVRRKMDCLYLLSQGLSRKTVQDIARINLRTLTSYIEQYRTGGLSAVGRVEYYRPSSAMEDYAEELIAYFTANPPGSIKQAASYIEERTGLKRSAQQVGQFLKRHGFRPLRSGILPAKADAGEQEEYKKKNWFRV